MVGGKIFKQWNVILATLFSVVLVGGAYVLARGFESPQSAQASSETALLQAIAAKDSDGDGLPDWEETLYGTDPHMVDTFHLGMTDGEAVAKGLIVPKAIANISSPTASSTPTSNSLTNAFAESFFTQYLAAKNANGGTDLTSAQSDALAGQVMDQLTKNFGPTNDYKTAGDIKVSGTGPDALRAFAIDAEAIMKKNAVTSTMSEIDYALAAVQGDSSAPDQLTALAKAYRDSAAGLATLPVPQELASTDLSMVNAIMRLGEIDSDLAGVNNDPLTAMLALAQYPQTEQNAEKAFITLANTYAVEGVVLPNGTPGSSFVNLMANLTAVQNAGDSNTTP